MCVHRCLNNAIKYEYNVRCLQVNISNCNIDLLQQNAGSILWIVSKGLLKLVKTATKLTIRKQSLV